MSSSSTSQRSSITTTTTASSSSTSWQPKSGRDRAKMLGLKSSRFESSRIGSSAHEIMESAKARHRTHMKPSEWGHDGYSRKRFCAELLAQCPDEIPRIDYDSISREEFIERIESKQLPCVFTNSTKGFDVSKYWTFDALYERYKDVEFKVGEDDKGKKIRVKFKYFLEYLLHNEDDSPLYMFESAIEDIKDARKMIEKYRVPKFFKEEDFFEHIGERRRPPYRWFLVGPERSGTTVHIDPINTSAWNTSLQGYKRWVLFPPGIPKDVVKAKKYVGPGEDDYAIQYFTRILPKLVQGEGRERLGVVEFLQGPGETVFIPGGWWHAVINVTDTIAVTQNFMNSVNIPVVWPSFRKERRKLACYAMKKFEKSIPNTHARLLAMNQADGFTMFDQVKSVKEKRFAEDDFACEQESRKPFDITMKVPLRMSTDETTSSSSSSASFSSSSSESRSRSRSRSHSSDSGTKSMKNQKKSSKQDEKRRSSKERSNRNRSESRSRSPRSRSPGQRSSTSLASSTKSRRDQNS